MFLRRRQILAAILIAMCSGVAGGSGHAAVNTDPDQPPQQPGRYELRKRLPGEESIFDITFGSPPPLATERGILIIDAYNDLNANRQQDAHEQPLIEEISCRLGEIDYRVPAFIPGLEYNSSYSITCTGRTYQPSGNQPEVFIEKRGQIIRLNIPCHPRLPATRPQAD